MTAYYASIVIPKQIRYEIFEEGEEGKQVSPQKWASQGSINKRQEYRLSSGPKPDHYNSYEKGSFAKKLPVAELPNLPPALVKEVERLYFGWKGPWVRHAKQNKSFFFGLWEFIVEKQGSKLMAKDVPQEIDPRYSFVPLPEQKQFIPIDDYFKKYDNEERHKCKAVNLNLLNDNQVDDDDDGEVGEEFDKD